MKDNEKLFGIGAVTGIVSVGLAQLANQLFSRGFDIHQPSAMIMSSGIMLMLFGIFKDAYFHQRMKKIQSVNSADI